MSDALFLEEVERTLEIYESAIGSAASRTRQMIERVGAVNTLTKLVASPDLQKGFKVLHDRNQLDRSFEALIVRFPELFSTSVVDAAKWRLSNVEQLLKK